jgi:hypothetical protein
MPGGIRGIDVLDGTFQVSTTSYTGTQIARIRVPAPEHLSEVDLMSAIYPLSIHRRIERQWAQRIDALKRTRGQIVAGTERAMQRVFNNDDAPLSEIVDRRRLDQP